MAEILTLVVDIGLGALAYRIAKTTRADHLALRVEVTAISEYLKERFGWPGLVG